jgi:NAD+-dependent protein deacetylase sirtuin 5
MRGQISPGSQFTLITQNVDGLCQRAVHKVCTEARPDGKEDISHPIEMHGSLFETICTNHDCGHREWNYDPLISPALAHELDAPANAQGDPVLASRSRFQILREELRKRMTVVDEKDRETLDDALDENLATCEGAEHMIPIADLPKCSNCAAQVRSGVVWFGERPREMDRIGKAVEQADLYLVIGTSSTVSYPWMVDSQG